MSMPRLRKRFVTNKIKDFTVSEFSVVRTSGRFNEFSVPMEQELKDEEISSMFV